MKFKLLVGMIFGVMFALSGSLVTAEINNKATVVKTEKIDYVKDVSSKIQFKETLRRGMQGEQVKELQRILQESGFYQKAIDGDYGSGTKAAVEQYQQKFGLSPDGVVGPKTFAKILETYTLPPEIAKEKPTICTMEYAPVCGQKVVNCIKAPCPQPEPETFGNKCGLNAAGAKYLYSGTCDSTKPVGTTCTKEYNPVCGLKDGVAKTFSNKCLMYGDEATFKYFGTCEEGQTTKPIEKEYTAEELQAKINLLMKQVVELQELLKNTQ